MGNAQWTFVICVSGWRPPGCVSAASDRSERLPVRHIIPAFQQAQPILIPRVCVCERDRIRKKSEFFFFNSLAVQHHFPLQFRSWCFLTGLQGMWICWHWECLPGVFVYWVSVRDRNQYRGEVARCYPGCISEYKGISIWTPHKCSLSRESGRGGEKWSVGGPVKSSVAICPQTPVDTFHMFRMFKKKKRNSSLRMWKDWAIFSLKA